MAGHKAIKWAYLSKILQLYYKLQKNIYNFNLLKHIIKGKEKLKNSSTKLALQEWKTKSEEWKVGVDALDDPWKQKHCRDVKLEVRSLRLEFM